MKLHKMVSAIFLIWSCASCSSSQTPHETAKQGTFSSSGARRQGVQTGRDAWNFDKDAIGGIPKGFTPATGKWKIVKDGSSPSLPHALAQEAESSRSTFNVILATQTNYANVDLSVKIKAVAGRIDQGGGPVWRAKDAKNYYIARYNPLEENFRVYKVVEGDRTQLESADIPHTPGWHTLRVTMVENEIRCYFDGKEHLKVTDSTFPEPGSIGLWSKADAQTYFDDLTVSGSPGGELDAEKIGQAAGVKASSGPDGVVRIGWPRTDIAVSVDGMPLKPFAGLGSWAAFLPAPQGAMVMGDTVVFEDEVSAAMDAAFAAGLEVTALHNHFFYDEPKVYFMHIGGRGNPEKLAAAVKSVWDAIKKVRAASVQPTRRFDGRVPQPGHIDAAAIEKILGAKPTVKDGVAKVVFSQEGSMHGIEVGGSMGLTTWAAFSGSDELAAVDGDFIMTAQQVQPVLRALRKVGIHIVALHNHMIGDSPTYYFTHFWGKGPSAELARGIKSALLAQENAWKISGQD